jgi:hypothetical protein
VTDWKSQESGTQGPATEGGTFGPLGIANPHFEPDRVPGTEFYRYRDNEYVYAATADAPDDGWRTLEARVDEHRVTAPADGLLRGYPYTNSALPGTAYYRVEGETYLWVRSEEGHRGLGGDVAADGGSVAGPLRRRGDRRLAGSSSRGRAGSRCRRRSGLGYRPCRARRRRPSRVAHWNTTPRNVGHHERLRRRSIATATRSRGP